MRHTFTIGVAVFALALGAGPGFAQERPTPRGGGGERTGGAATPRGGGGSEARGGGESGSSSGGGMSGGSSMGTSSSPSAPSSSGSAVGAPPVRSADRDRSPRRGGGEATGRRAVPRGESAAAGASSTSRDSGTNGSVDRATGRSGVPTYARPRDGRPVTGAAVDRGTVVGQPPRDIFYIYRPYYYPYGFYGSGIGYGLGYLYYDPFWYGGYGYPYGGYGGYYGNYGGGGYYSGGGSYERTYRDAGALRLKITPREGQVYVDGYFVGEVDSFDGLFQKLTLDGGGHRVEIRAEGYEPLQFDVLITPGETVTYKGQLKRVQ